MKRPMLLVLALVAGATAFDGAALAKSGRSDLVRDRVTMTPQAFDGRARLRVRRDAPDRQEIRLQVQRAAAGLDLRVFVEDAAGVITEVGTLTESGAGEYMWRVRTKKGDALPFGQSDLSGLSGRAIEVRTAAGAVAFSSAFPVIRAANAPARTKRALRNNLAVDRRVADAIGAPGLTASTEISLRRGGRQRFGVRVANAVSGQTFGVWIEDPLTGEMKYLSSITAGAPPVVQKSAEADVEDGETDDVDDDDSDDDGVEDEHEDEGEMEFDTEDGDDLPDGAESVSDLAGLGVEIRTESGDVVAEGEIPSVGEDPRADDDDHDGVEDGDEDEGDDEVEDEVEDETGGDDAAGI